MKNESNPYRHREVSAQALLNAPDGYCRLIENLITKELNEGCR